jgi:hypothetical protein
MVKYAYIVNFAFIFFIYFNVRHTGKAGEKPLRKRVKRVVNRLFYNYTLAYGCLKAEKVFYGNNVRGLYVFNENQLSYSGFIESRKALLKSILLYFFIISAEILH